MGYGVSVLSRKNYNFEKIQSRAIRYFLGVHPKTRTAALFGEMGWLQFKFTRCTWNRFVQMDEVRLNKQVFLSNFYVNSQN